MRLRGGGDLGVRNCLQKIESNMDQIEQTHLKLITAAIYYVKITAQNHCNQRVRNQTLISDNH